MDYKYLYIMFPKKETRNAFLTQCILTFGLTLETLSSLLNADKEYLYNNLFTNNPFYRNLTRTVKHTIKEQEKAKEKFTNYFNSLKEAYQNKDKEKIRELLRVINDKDAIKLMKDKKEQQRLTDEEVLIMLKYQLKYMLTSKETSKIYSIDRGTYHDRIKKLESEYPELVAEYSELAYVNTLLFHKRGR